MDSGTITMASLQSLGTDDCRLAIHLLNAEDVMMFVQRTTKNSLRTLRFFLVSFY